MGRGNSGQTQLDQCSVVKLQKHKAGREKFSGSCTPCNPISMTVADANIYSCKQCEPTQD